MSAIAGLFYREMEAGRQVEASEMQAMHLALAFRGPDGSRQWLDGPVGLIQERALSTRESALENLPWNEPGGRLAITADARLDNRAELLAQLGWTPAQGTQTGDGGLILAAYEKWGEACPQTLLGEFAFAIWDQRRQRLFCARDHFGIKPFYYTCLPGSFAFASQIKGLLALSALPRKLNEIRIADYLAGIFEDKAITFYQYILRLPPAHCLSIECDHLRIWPYWSLNPEAEVRLKNDADYVEAFRELFCTAVRSRMNHLVPLGSLLSGGMDSSSVACAARQCLASDEVLPTFSVIFPHLPRSDEQPFIQAVLDQGGFQPQFLHGDQFSPLADWELMDSFQDEPYYSANLFLFWELARLASMQGIRILLDGMDGDTTVSHGLAYLTELSRRGRWRSVLGETWLLARRMQASPWPILFNRGVRPLVPSGLRGLQRRLRHKSPGHLARLPNLHPDFVRRYQLEERYAGMMHDRSGLPLNERQDHFLRLTSGWLPFYLEVSDRNAAAFQLEMRFPFFDRRLVEFCLALPPSQKLGQGFTRLILHRAMEGILPPKVQWRGDKSDLSHNFNRGLLHEDRPQIEAVKKDLPLLAEYARLEALQAAFDRYLVAGHNSDAMTVWSAVTLSLWLSRTGITA